MKKSILILFVLIASASTHAQTQSKTYPGTLKKYMEVSGSMTAFKSVVTTMMGSFKSMYSSVPDEVWAEFTKEFSTTSIDDLVLILAPVYEQQLTESDLNDVIKFYSTPAGKKLAEKTPAIMEGSMTAGQTWGMKVAEKLQTKMKEKGY